MRAPIIYLEKTKKKRDEPSSNAIFAELGTKANKTDENKTKKIPKCLVNLKNKPIIDYNLLQIENVGRIYQKIDET